MSKKIDLTGQRFGRLTVICENGRSKSGAVRWLCKCDCGKEIPVLRGHLRSGHTKSCRHCNNYVVQGPIATCTTNNGKAFIVDAEDVEIIRNYTWGIDKNGYVKTQISLHRFLLDAPYGGCVDHINGNPLDCRKANLRIASHKENCRNTRVRSNSVTGYKGVSRTRRKYQARIHVDGKTKYLGVFETPEAAALAYNEAAIKYFGEFAKPNPV